VAAAAPAPAPAPAPAFTAADHQPMAFAPIGAAAPPAPPF